MTDKKKASVPAWTKFATGGAAGISGWLFVHPADVIKARSARIAYHAPNNYDKDNGPLIKQ